MTVTLATLGIESEPVCTRGQSQHRSGDGLLVPIDLEAQTDDFWFRGGDSGGGS